MVFSLLVTPRFAFASTAQSVSSVEKKIELPLATSIEQPPSDIRVLEQEVKKKREVLEVLQKQIEIYQKTVLLKQEERLTLQRQLGILEEHVTKTNLDIEATKQQLDIFNLESKKINAQLAELTKEVNEQRQRLGLLLNRMRQAGERGTLEFLLSAESFSSLFDAIATNEQLSGSVVRLLDHVKELRAQQNARKDELNAKAEQKRQAQASLFASRTRLVEDRETKEYLVAKTQESEKKFQQFLESARYEEEQADADIRRLEKDIREKLAAQPPAVGRLGVGEKIPLMYPVPFAGIAAGFHDPTYIFRRIFEHPAIDLRTLVNGRPTNAQPVRAAANGYVGRARDAGMGYSYIMLIHSDRLSTVYGHVSKILVAPEQYVNQGDVIALSGGLPGTPGAGRLTTGPHLHFEVRLDGIPVNPVNYLPPA